MVCLNTSRDLCAGCLGEEGSCLKTGQHFIFVIIYLLLPIKCIIFESVSKILFIFLLPIIIIMILILKILLHNVLKIINLWYPTYVYQFLNFPYNYKNRVLACFQTRPERRSLSVGAAVAMRGAVLECGVLRLRPRLTFYV